MKDALLEERLAGEVRSLPETARVAGDPSPIQCAGRNSQEGRKMIGRTLSHYRVLKQLGAGGMGVVYLARDTRLERDVAIKMLPKEFARDSDRLSRFRREAKALASLNHSNIGAIYGLEEPKRGVVFLVLELIDGDTLAVRLRGGPLPAGEALAVCAQIAAALAAAHQRGVIHRDLKPANVMLTASGHAKVLDFGLARRVTLPTTASTTTFLTKPGVAMGTLGYASPEQIRGEEHDGRADIFALGCVLYECLTGKRAFSGDTAADVLAATLKQDPDWAALPSETLIEVRDLLQHCLRKEPLDRPRSMDDARLEIDGLLGTEPPGGRMRGAQTAVPNNLPRQLTSFVGREREIAECRRLLEGCRLLTLTGSGGCGKSRLSLRLAEESLAERPDGVWFVDFAPLSDAARVPHAVVSAVGVRADGAKSPSETLTNHMRGRRTLLVLDNCEHVVASCAELAGGLLQSCPELKILATSREGLGALGEQSFAVPPLSLPSMRDATAAESVACYEAIRLFVERAALVQPEFRLTDHNAGAVAEICRRLDGLPLAIELAAARARVLSAEEIRSRLDDRFRFLTGGSRTALSRHQTLGAAIQWSYDQLTSDEKQLFRVLSVFEGGWTLEAVLAVYPTGGDEFQILELVTRLVDKSLVVVERGSSGESRYKFLESVRQYAIQELHRAGEGAAARGLHADYFLALARQSDPRICPGEGVKWFRLFEADHENLLAALSWYGDGQLRVDKALELAGLLVHFWRHRGHVAIGRRALDDALGREEGIASSPARCRALCAAGILAFVQADYAAAQLRYVEALAVARHLGERETIARALIGRGDAAILAGDYALARACFDEMLASCREVSDRRGMGTALLHSGFLAQFEGDHGLSSSLFERSLVEFREGGETQGVGTALINLGEAASRRGDHGSARSLYQESLAASREAKDPPAMVVALVNLALVSLRVGEPASVRAPLVEALRLAQELKWKPEGAYPLEGSAELAAALGQAERAVKLYGAARALREETGTPKEYWYAKSQERAIAQIRAEIGEEVFAARWAEGRDCPFEDAVSYALEWLEGGSPDTPPW